MSLISSYPNPSNLLLNLYPPLVSSFHMHCKERTYLALRKRLLATPPLQTNPPNRSPVSFRLSHHLSADLTVSSS